MGVRNGKDFVSRLFKSFFSSTFEKAPNSIIYCRMLELYPNGLPQLNGSHVSLFLVLVDRTPDAKVYADYTLCMVNQSNSNHISFKSKFSDT